LYLSDSKGCARFIELLGYLLRKRIAQMRDFFTLEIDGNRRILLGWKVSFSRGSGHLYRRRMDLANQFLCDSPQYSLSERIKGFYRAYCLVLLDSRNELDLLRFGIDPGNLER